MDRGTQRLDLHNPEIDDDAAQAGQCGMTHLATGWHCLLPARHLGSCDFVHPGTGRPDDVQDGLRPPG